MSPTRPLVILIGPPLSGKTTFVTAIQRDYGIPGISVEDLIKDHASELRKLHPEGTSLAEMRYDPAMSRYLRTRLDNMDLSHGAALDGFPATRMQAEDLAKMIADLRLNPIVLQLEIPDKRFASALLQEVARVTAQNHRAANQGLPPRIRHDLGLLPQCQDREDRRNQIRRAHVEGDAAGVGSVGITSRKQVALSPMSPFNSCTHWHS